MNICTCSNTTDSTWSCSFSNTAEEQENEEEGTESESESEEDDESEDEEDGDSFPPQAAATAATPGSKLWTLTRSTLPRSTNSLKNSISTRMLEAHEIQRGMICSTVDVKSQYNDISDTHTYVYVSHVFHDYVCVEIIKRYGFELF